jgi:hypothetical protein
MPLYLLHFDRPYEHARHYLGYSSGDPIHRITLHRAGRSGCRLTEAVARAGISMSIGWCCYVGDRHDERRLKERSHLPLLCRRCAGHAAASRRWRRIARAIEEGRQV